MHMASDVRKRLGQNFAFDPGSVQKTFIRADAPSYRVRDACMMAGVGRTKLYELVNAGKLKKHTVAGCTLIDGDSLRALFRLR
jgi:hypothetical protein